MKYYRLCLSAALLILLCSTVAVAKGEQGVAATSDLGEALVLLSRTQGFSCRFEQVLSYAEGGQRRYKGDLSVSYPGKFRWHYTDPYEQLYVSQGDGIWFYEPDLMQVQWLQDLGEVAPMVVMKLLDGRLRLADIQVLEATSLIGDLSVWHVRVGQHEHSVEIWLGVQDKRLRWIESRDMLSNRNRLNLLHMNLARPEVDQFKFNAPEGVDVIGVVK